MAAPIVKVPASLTKTGKQRVSMTIDSAIIDFFKEAAAADGDRPYQPMMARVLADYIKQQQSPKQD